MGPVSSNEPAIIWGYQSAFRRGTEMDVERSLAAIGVKAKPTIFVIGLGPEGSRPRLVIEQDHRGLLVTEHFDGIDQRAAEIYHDDPDSGALTGDHQRDEKIRQEDFARAYGRAILQVVEGVVGDQLRFAISRATVVNGYSIFMILGLPESLFRQVPQLLSPTVFDRYPIARSLLEAAVKDLLSRKEVELYQPDASGDMEDINTADVAASAARDLLASVTGLAVGKVRPDFFDGFNKLATMRYEQRVGIGSILLAVRTSEFVSRSMQFRDPVELSETRACRKLLETSSSDGESLLIDAYAVYGLGQLNKSTYPEDAEAVFEVRITGPGKWDLRHGDNTLMAVEFGAPRLPEGRVDRGRFDDICGRILGEYDSEALWELTLASADAAHGTMLVISDAAQAEAKRLQSQATTIEPTPLSDDLVRQVTAIDGAILVDPHGICHSIGVILDGTATVAGDRSRGARYNSAVKYLASAGARTVILIVSEDGMVNILPSLRPKISRRKLDSMLAALRDASSAVPANGERFYRAHADIEANQFYFSSEQLSEINTMTTQHWEQRKAEGAKLIVYEPELEANPEMSDDYLTD
jgi:DisA bacterial checkpoint controller nucleotide-binding